MHATICKPIKLDIPSVSKECSQAWKSLPKEQRKYWDYVSNKEKEEYKKQAETYDGPWRVATNKLKKRVRVLSVFCNSTLVSWSVPHC